MSKSIKLKDNNYIDSSGISHNREKLKNWLNELLLFLDCQKSIFTGTNDGVKIKINQEYADKMPILMLGADNVSATPIVTVIKTHGNYINLGDNKTLTTDGINWHIDISQWSTLWVIAPRGANIELSNEPL